MRSKARQVWVTLHRWVGLLAGIWLVVIGLSGSYLVFYQEIDRLLNPDWARPQARLTQAARMQTGLDNARSAMPDHFLHSVFPADGPSDVHHVWFTPSAEDMSRMWEVLVDPNDGRVLGQREAVPTLDFTRRNLGNAVYTLHFQLLLGDRGNTLVGFVGLFALVSGLSGLVLWWPRTHGWRAVLTIKPGTGGVRWHFDLHRVTAIYSFPLLMAVTFTGVTLTFGTQTRAALHTVSPVRSANDAPLPPFGSAADSTIDVDEVLRIAQREIPTGTVRCLWLPGAAGPAWRVSLREAHGAGWAGGRAELWLHPNGGQVLERWRHESGSGADTYLSWQLPLHNGSVLGLPGRVAVCLLGVVPLILAITGTAIWWRKRRGRLHKDRNLHHQY